MLDPDLILHIALPDEWAEARAVGEYRRSTRGRSLDEIGFVHCSYPSQVVRVANFAYGDVAEVVLLHIDPELVEAEVRVEPGEPGGTELFPHVYGPIPTAAVVDETWWERGDDGLWHRPVLR